MLCDSLTTTTIEVLAIPASTHGSNSHRPSENSHFKSGRSPARLDVPTQEMNQNSDMRAASDAFRSLDTTRISERKSKSKEESRRRDARRSRSGCSTCQRRKVKCDELKPVCGACLRLKQKCDWHRSWRFKNVDTDIKRLYKHISPVGPPSYGSRSAAATVCSCHQSMHGGISDTRWDTHQNLQCRALTLPPGSLNIILTPESFSQQDEYGGPNRNYEGFAGLLFCSGAQPTEAPEIIPIHGFEDRRPIVSPTRLSSRDHSPTLPSSLEPTVYLKQSTRYNLPYDVEPVLRRVLAVSSKLDLKDLLLASQRLQPLCHAICALVMLSLAQDEQPHFLTGAFHSYHLAITTCLTEGCMSEESLIYFHFILLLYDIRCVDQANSTDGHMWSQHLLHLRDLRKKHIELNETHTYMFRYTLSLDTQSSLAGNLESGSFTQAWELDEPDPIPVLLPGLYSDMIMVSRLNERMSMTLAKLSQLALQMRKSVGTSSSDTTEARQRISAFHSELQSSWDEHYPGDISQAFSQADPQWPHPALTVLRLASIQYSTAVAYLFTSMFRSQRTQTSDAEDREIACHCGNIITMANKLLEDSSSHSHQIAFSIFLAGVISTNEHHKRRALDVIQTLSRPGIGSNASKTQKLLEAVYAEQTAKVENGKRATEVDWISFAQECGIKIVNFGL